MTSSATRMVPHTLGLALTFACLTGCDAPEAPSSRFGPVAQVEPEVAPSATAPLESIPGSGGRWIDLHDLAILYPLPRTREAGEASWIRAGSVAREGALVPRSAFSLLFPSGRTDGALPSTYEDLALVAVRIDPCYMRPSACEPQVRAVFQGVSWAAATERWVVSDGAVHVTYTVSHHELRALTDGLVAARSEAIAGPLGPHASITREGPSGPFATKLRTLWLSYLGEARTTVVTGYDHTELEGEHRWTFAKVERFGAAFVASRIPTTSSFTEVVHGSSPRDSWDASFASVEVEPTKDAVTALVGRARSTSSGPSLTAAYEGARRVVGPSRHDESTTTCANCHLAEGALAVAARYGMDATASASSPARGDVRTSVSNLHAFGYLDRDPAIAERTAAEIAASWRGLFPTGER